MFRILLFILAIILSGVATFLTATGMTALFSGLWFMFILIDLGRFLVSDYLIKSWKQISSIKYFTTAILACLLVLSSVGVYNALDQRIPTDMHNAIVEAASYNKNALNNEKTQDINKTGYEIALSEYNNQVSSYEIQKNACLNKEGADQEKCVRTYNANLSAAKKRLDTAKKEYTTSIKDSTSATQEEYKNQTEIAGILTTICHFTGGHCDTTQGLTRALRIIILLLIIGLEIFALNILFIIHSKELENKIPEKKKEEVIPEVKIEEIVAPELEKKGKVYKKKFIITGVSEDETPYKLEVFVGSKKPITNEHIEQIKAKSGVIFERFKDSKVCNITLEQLINL